MEQLQPESFRGAERKGTSGPKANVAPGIEVELGRAGRASGGAGWKGRRRKIARAAQHVVVVERGGGGTLGWAGCRPGGADCARELERWQ